MDKSERGERSSIKTQKEENKMIKMQKFRRKKSMVLQKK